MQGYATGHALSEAGVISGADMTTEDCDCKTVLLTQSQTALSAIG